MRRRSRVLAGNWKLHKGPSETKEFFEEFLPLHEPHEGVQVVFFPPAISVPAAMRSLRERSDIRLGVQNVFWETNGAFTGEISAPLAADAGARYALIGHSERRHVFGESVEDTVRKTAAVLEAGLTPVLCVGETIEERRGGRAEQVVRSQLDPVLEKLSAAEVSRLQIAYEPVWAIGTGETASPADATAMHAFIRRTLGESFGEDAAETLLILYGGSVKPDNAGELLAEPEIDGVLVGGASLKPADFATICKAAA